MNKNATGVWGLQQGIGNDDDVRRLYFFKKLQAVTDKIHATDKINQIILDLSPDICELFGCERLTIYTVGEGRTTIETMIKTGLNSFKDFSLPISGRSVAGYVALSKKSVNIADAYDDREMAAFNPSFQFLKKVDKRTGFRTREMLVAPILHDQTRELLGVLQIINNRAGGAFSNIVEEGAVELCNTLALAFSLHRQQAPLVRSRYYPLVSGRVISGPALELAEQSARRKNIGVEQVLINEFQVSPAAIGAALASHFGVPYEPYRAGRAKPLDLLKNIKREFAELKRWLPLQDEAGEITVLATDSERTRESRAFAKLFPGAPLRFLVTTESEFAQTVEQFFGEDTELDQSFGNTIPGDPSGSPGDDLLLRVKQTIISAFGQSAADIHIEIVPGREETATTFHSDGTPESVSGQVTVNFHFNFPLRGAAGPATQHQEQEGNAEVVNAGPKAAA
jgi:hypothetical protein